MTLLTGSKIKGFLLLELMISIAVFSIAFVLILTSFVSSIRAMDFSKDCFRAGLLLECKIYEVYYVDRKEDLSKGTFADFNKEFSWSLDIVSMEEDLLDEVLLKVFWNKRNIERDLTVVSLFK